MWKRNENMTEMHKMYMDGYSLSEVGKKYGVSRQSVYVLFKYNNLETRPNATPLPFVIFNGKKYTKRNTGYFGRTTDDRTLLHRDVWELNNGKIEKGFDIHHIDGDKENNELSNLECLSKSEHTRLYSPHNNQYTKGRKK
jgi:hypothetical protein